MNPANQTADTGVRLTRSAAEHVSAFLAKNGGDGLRLAVKPTGCSGYKYVVEPATAALDGDQRFSSHGVDVVVDPQSFEFLRGTEVDFVREGLNKGFRFHNPNVAATCGCGESFNIAAAADKHG
jgi:iron-sulfur cluster assembly protein